MKTRAKEKNCFVLFSFLFEKQTNLKSGLTEHKLHLKCCSKIAVYGLQIHSFLKVEPSLQLLRKQFVSQRVCPFRTSFYAVQ